MSSFTISKLHPNSYSNCFCFRIWLLSALKTKKKRFLKNGRRREQQQQQWRWPSCRPRRRGWSREAQCCLRLRPLRLSGMSMLHAIATTMFVMLRAAATSATTMFVMWRSAATTRYEILLQSMLSVMVRLVLNAATLRLM